MRRLPYAWKFNLDITLQLGSVALRLFIHPTDWWWQAWRKGYSDACVGWAGLYYIGIGPISLSIDLPIHPIGYPKTIINDDGSHTVIYRKD